jgi:hypothetical protein
VAVCTPWIRSDDHAFAGETQVDATLAMVSLAGRSDVPVSELAYGEKRRLEIGLALATSAGLAEVSLPKCSGEGHPGQHAGQGAKWRKRPFNAVRTSPSILRRRPKIMRRAID